MEQGATKRKRQEDTGISNDHEIHEEQNEMSPKEKGQQVMQAALTIFRDREECIAEFKLDNNVSFWRIGNEICPTTGRYHCHAFLQFHKKIKLGTVSRRYRCRAQKILDPQQWYIYVGKEGSVVESGILRGSDKGDLSNDKKNRYTRLLELAYQAKFGEILDEDPVYACNKGLRHLREARNVKVAETYGSSYRNGMLAIWVYGVAGTGKTEWVRNIFPDAYKKDETKWWDLYNGERVVLIDEFKREHVQHVSKLLKWCEGMACYGEIKGGTVPLEHRILVITANHHPTELFDKEDWDPIMRRFLVVKALKRDFQQNDTLVNIEGRRDVNNYMGPMDNVYLNNYLLNYDFL